jgi:hypothetical protein
VVQARRFAFAIELLCIPSEAVALRQYLSSAACGGWGFGSDQRVELYFNFGER